MIPQAGLRRVIGFLGLTATPGRSSFDGMGTISDSPDGFTTCVHTSTDPCYFATTHWSAVLAAGSSDSPESRLALEQLCLRYWSPLYQFVRRRGYSVEDAQDLTQQFFARLLQRGSVAAADPARGRFRSFLLASLKNFLADEWDKSRAQKRGGGLVLAIDVSLEERRLDQAEPVTPEMAFERRWALALLEQVYERLQIEFMRHGKARLFDLLRGTLAGERTETRYAEIGRSLGMTEAAVKMAAARLRRRYRELLRQAIAGTVPCPEEIEEELRHLLRVLAG